MKSFGVTRQRSRLDSTQPHQTEERVFREPVLGTLRAEVLEEQFSFAASDGFVEMHKEVRQAEIAIEFRDFVLKNQMIAERVPRQFANQPMILVQVGAVVREDYIRRWLLL